MNENAMSTQEFWNERVRRINEPTHANARDRQAYLQRLLAGMSSSDQRYDETAAEEQSLFLAEWTAEITAARRLEWNTWVRAQGSKIPAAKVNAKVASLGWTLDSLQRAVKLHG